MDAACRQGYHIPVTPQQQSDLIARLAHEAGFDRVGIAPAGPLPRQEYVRQWLLAGHHGEMEYLHRWAELRSDPRLLLPGARSVIVVAHVYRHETRAQAEIQENRTQKHGNTNSPKFYPSPPFPLSPSHLSSPTGRVARYAWGRDYHKIIRKKLQRLLTALRNDVGEPFDARICVDTAPVIERELAAAAGIGWIGKNTLVLHQELGSYFFLAEILTTLQLPPATPATDHCGTCTRCLDACPTQALTAPYQMDASRCISYLTIEHRGGISPDLQPLMGNWVYGCDICQEVCPHNRKAPLSREPAYAPLPEGLPPEPALAELLTWNQEDHQQRLAGSAAKRASLPMLQRNARIATANLRARQ